MMRYPEELVDAGEYSFPPAKDLRKPELNMARTLVENLADKWDPSQYHDRYRENLMKIIKAKVKGAPARGLKSDVDKHPAEVVDLMERLRQSLQAAGGTRGARAATKTAKPRKAGGRGKTRRRAA
jgi:DNA end-binding protein Ku